MGAILTPRKWCKKCSVKLEQKISNLCRVKLAPKTGAKITLLSNTTTRYQTNTSEGVILTR